MLSIAPQWKTCKRGRCGAATGERLRACPEILFWVERATGLPRPAARRAEWEARAEAMKMGLLQRGAALFRSAGRRPARAGRPCYPFSRPALRTAQLQMAKCTNRPKGEAGAERASTEPIRT